MIGPVEAVTYGKEIFLTSCLLLSMLMSIPAWCKSVNVPNWFKFLVTLMALWCFVGIFVGGLIWIWE